MLRTCGASRKEVFTLPDCSMGLAMRAHRAMRFEGRVSRLYFSCAACFLRYCHNPGMWINGVQDQSDRAAACYPTLGAKRQARIEVSSTAARTPPSVPDEDPR
jgi:hypothetical protein